MSLGWSASQSVDDEAWTGPIEPTITEHSLLAVLHREWFPCTAGRTIYDHISQSDSGPFLRSLAYEWERVGRPQLRSLEELQIDGGGTASTIYPTSLPGLARQQDLAIAELVQSAMQRNPSFSRPKPFDAFAAQLGFYSSIRSDLQATTYKETWNGVLQCIDEVRTRNCHPNTHHVCLGQLLFGEAYQWPLKALHMAFVGYNTQLQTSRLIPDLVHELQIERLLPSSTVTTASSGSESVVTPATSMSEEQVSSPLAAILRRMSRSSSSARPALDGDDEQYDVQHSLTSNSTAQEFTNHILQARRPTLTDFWDPGVMQMLQSVDQAHTQTEPTHSAEQPGYSTAVASQHVEEQAYYFDQAWHTMDLSAIETLSRSISMPIQPIPSSSSSESRSPSSSLHVDEQVTPFILPPGSTSFTPMNVVNRRRRPPMRKRSSTMESVSSRYSDTLFVSSTGLPADSDIPSSRVRSQRHYAKLVAQRTLITEMLKNMERITEEKIQGPFASNPHLKLIKAYFDEAKTGTDSFSLPSEQPSDSRTVDPNQRKRESKKRIRNADVRNIRLLNRIAELLVETPLAQLCMLVKQVVRAYHADGSSRSQDLHQDPLSAYIGAWIACRHAWPDLSSAEKRLLQGTNVQLKSITAFIGLLQIAFDETCI